jgi:rhodanese-related sulfurtransferase
MSVVKAEKSEVLTMFKQLSAQDFAHMQQTHQDFMLIDVREQNEYEQAHIAGSILVPLSQLAEELPNLKLTSKNLVVQCQGGVRSQKACALIQQFNPDLELYNLDGGLNAWMQNGLPTKS